MRFIIVAQGLSFLNSELTFKLPSWRLGYWTGRNTSFGMWHLSQYFSTSVWLGLSFAISRRVLYHLSGQLKKFFGRTEGSLLRSEQSNSTCPVFITAENKKEASITIANASNSLPLKRKAALRFMSALFCSFFTKVFSSRLYGALA